MALHQAVLFENHNNAIHGHHAAPPIIDSSRRHLLARHIQPTQVIVTVYAYLKNYTLIASIYRNLKHEKNRRIRENLWNCQSCKGRSKR